MKNPGRDRKLESMEYFSFETQKDGNVISESGGADTVLSYLNFQTPHAIDSPRERETLQINADSSASRKTVNSIAHPLLCLESIIRSALCPEHHHKESFVILHNSFERCRQS